MTSRPAHSLAYVARQAPMLVTEALLISSTDSKQRINKAPVLTCRIQSECISVEEQRINILHYNLSSNNFVMARAAGNSSSTTKWGG